ncbi:4-amino-4-deoxy-L-arabinose transferase [Nocardioides sp. DS6]|uniref:4-amino-4-deoxy-L-arabinose transferase n=1 Tax=Nocardioides eburneus TaxID=3231482 RepID=A0ABV3T1Y6_9ACTN
MTRGASTGAARTVGPAARAAEVLALVRTRPATLGDGRLICIDGPAGSGKSTLASAIVEASGAAVVHLDDLYDGWDGLPRLDDQLDPLLRPLAAGRPGSYRRYDWQAMAYDGVVTVPPAPLLVLEGVGSGSAAYARLCTVLVWVEAPYELRRRRGLARDGDAFAPHWETWARSEDALFARDRTRDRADVVVQTGSGTPTGSRDAGGAVGPAG